MIRTLAAALATSTCIVALATPAAAQTREYNIPAGSLKQAIDTYVRQSGRQVVYRADEVRSVRSPGVRGVHSADAALAALLAGSGFTTRIDGKLIAIVKTGNGDAASSVASLGEDDQASFRQGQDTEITSGEILVTGTRIVGVKDKFSPVSSFNRDDIDQAGFSDVADLVASLPQNFGGGVSIDTNPAGASFGAGSESVNLRGLGAESTLTLLNGRRLAPGGLAGSFVDISAIPLVAIDRVEVLTDGASAIYGADAIAGVVNVILREDYNGAESRIRFATPTEGDGDQIQIGQTFGKAWDGGRLLVSYEFSDEDSVLSNDKDFAAGNPPEDELLPATKRHSVFASSGLKLADGFEVFVDGYYNRRDTQNTSSFVFFLDPSTTVQDVDVEQFGGTFGLSYEFLNGWRVEATASLADSSAFAASSSPFSDYTDQSDTRIWSYETTVGGPLFDIGSNSAQIVIGAQYRAEDYTGLSITLPNIPQLDITNDRNVTAVFGELYVPLVNAGNSRPGIDSLAVTAALRRENYSDVGSSTNPKFGIAYAPFEGFGMRATYGTSFRAPLLSQLVDQISFTFLSEYLDPSLPGGTATALFISGSTSQLQPETAQSWTVGFDFEPSFAPGFELRGTYFNIDYEDRIGSAFPSFDPNSGAAFGLDIPPILNPDLATLQGFVNATQNNFDFTPAGATLSDVTVLGDLRPLNTSASMVDGFDFKVGYRHQAGDGQLYVLGNATYLLNFERQFSETTPRLELLNTVTNPVDFRARLGLGWSSSQIGITSFVNYVDGYLNDQVIGAPERIGSWTTIDLNLRADLGSLAGGLLDGTELNFTVRNIFDADPPAVARAPGALRYGYDAANADPQGRVVSFQITKRW